MNSDTGQIYRTRDEINAAILRGERLEPIGPRVAEEDKAGHPGRGRAATLAATMLSMSGMSYPAPRPPRQLTDFDREQLDKAQEKRDRKQQLRAARAKK